MEVGKDENLDMLLKDWLPDNVDEPKDLLKENAIQYVEKLKDSGYKAGEAIKGATQ
jgi:hypothetical protein